MTEISPGFANSQLVDTRIMCKYALHYLRSYFLKVYAIKAQALAGTRSIWGLEEKDRGHHAHHAIDAMIVACMRPAFYEVLARYYHEFERYQREEAPKPRAPQPWPDFDRYVNEQMKQEILCVHHHRENLLKPTRKYLRHRGRVVLGPHGKPIILQGNTVRGQLHKESIYGKIRLPPTKEQTGPGELVCVIRKKLDASFDKFDAIVDPAIRRLVEQQRDRLKAGETVWFDEQRNIPIKSVRIKERNKPESMLDVGAHQDMSKHDYKRHRFAANSGNFITALYRGTLNNKPKGDYKIVNNFEAAEAVRLGTWSSLLPAENEKGLRLTHILKSGTLVLFYRTSPDELMSLSNAEVGQRLYQVTAMEGRLVQFLHHACGLGPDETGKGISIVNWEGAPAPKYRLSINGVNLLVNGVDFRLSKLGDIQWLEHSDVEPGHRH
jgi:CRISPR-associated endonuclease Csn1